MARRGSFGREPTGIDVPTASEVGQRPARPTESDVSTALPATEALGALFAHIEATRREHRDPLVVFDLDGTLYDNTHRTLRILLEFAHTHAVRYPELLKALGGFAVKDLKYRVSDTLAVLGFTDPGLVGEVFAFWKDRFFTDAYCLYDLPIAGGPEVVREVHRRGGVPCYLTGRDAPNMLKGTLETLQRDGFPVGRVDTRLILKPDFAMDDMLFKEGVISHLRGTGRVVGSFDNEPGLCNMFKAAFPEATVVWLDTSHAPGAPALRDDIVVVKDFCGLVSKEIS